jgi:hypothetical protein
MTDLSLIFGSQVPGLPQNHDVVKAWCRKRYKNFQGQIIWCKSVSVSSKCLANCMKWEIIQNNSSCIVCVTPLNCWTEGNIHRFFKWEVLFWCHEITTNLHTFTSWSDKFGQKYSVQMH